MQMSTSVQSVLTVVPVMVRTAQTAQVHISAKGAWMAGMETDTFVSILTNVYQKISIAKFQTILAF